jgi:nucleoid DNA-binding protein
MRNFPAEDIRFMSVNSVPDCKESREGPNENYMRSMSMTKRDLAVKIAKKTGLTQQEVGKIVQMLLDSIADEIAAGKTVELRNFGVFKVVTCKSRKGRNPKKPTDEVIIPEHCVAKFRAGKELRARIEVLNPEKLRK